MGNPFCHVELATDDLGKAKEFYGKLFSWKLDDMPMGPGMTYTMIGVGEGTGGGMMKKPAPEIPTMWMPYVLVEDVTASAEKAKALGGKILKEKTEVPQAGWFVVVSDPSGGCLGLWQAMKK